MKILCLFIALLFLIACSPSFESTQKVIEKPINVSKNITANITKPVNITANNTLLKPKIIKKEIKGVTHIIEVSDVSSDGESCLLKVDGVPILIDEGEQGIVNGVKIFVSEVRVLHDYTQENDLCELVISGA